MTGRGPIILLASLLIASLVFIGYLGRSVMRDLDSLSTAQNDDVSWRMSQLEVEVLQLQNAANDAIRTADSDLSGFRQRFDIFYSRIATLQQSALFQDLRSDPVAQSGLAAGTAFLDYATPIIDGADVDLRATLPDLRSRIAALRPEMRSLALAGIEVFAHQDVARREAFSFTLVKLALSVLALVGALIVTVAVLVKLFRRGQRFSHDTQVMRSRLEAVVTSSLDAVLAVDTKGRILEFNGAAETVFGYSRDEALGADMAELIVPQHMRQMHQEGMTRFLETGEQKVIGAGRVRLEGMRKSGEVFPVELSISLADADGERVFVSFLRDITKELQAEEDLRTARDKAQESEKAKSDLLTVMSHEMRTPLNGILGSLSLIDADNLNDRQKRHLSSIAVSGELLLSHVNDVLDLSSLTADAQSHEKTRFDLRHLVQSVAESLTANAEARGNRLTVDFLSNDLGVVLGFKKSLQQCLVNLIGNAIKFTTDGLVSVEVERLPKDEIVEIRVSDTGVGIAPQNLERVFEEFVMIDTAFARETAGTGLGLAITKRLVTAMEGEIAADSLLDEGSLFTLRVPLPKAGLARQKAPAVSQSSASGEMSGLTALVVDDNEINRMIIKDMLSDMGFEVSEAADGYEAIRAVSDRAFDVLLLDISMPGIDGIETLARIRGLDVAWCDVPALAVTAHASASDRETILDAPFGDLLVKPVDPVRLRNALANALQVSAAETAEPAQESLAADFQARFGMDAYKRNRAQLHRDVLVLIQHLTPEPELSEMAKQEAHRLAGSAAVLGESCLHMQLQSVEGCDEAGWLASKEALLDALKTAVDA